MIGRNQLDNTSPVWVMAWISNEVRDQNFFPYPMGIPWVFICKKKRSQSNQLYCPSNHAECGEASVCHPPLLMVGSVRSYTCPLITVCLTLMELQEHDLVVWIAVGLQPLVVY